jgi:hypothetical protein
VRPGESSAELGRLTSVLLLVMGLLSLFEVGIVLQGWISGTPYIPPTTPTEGIGALQLLFAGTVCIWLLVVLAAAVFFLLWLRQTAIRQRAYAPAPARTGLARLARTLSLFIPYPQLKDAFAAEGTGPGDRDPQLELWLACVVVVCIAGAIQLAVGTTGTSSLVNALTCIRELLLAAAAFLAARFVSELDRRSARRRALSK